MPGLQRSDCARVAAFAVRGFFVPTGRRAAHQCDVLLLYLGRLRPGWAATLREIQAGSVKAGFPALNGKQRTLGTELPTGKTVVFEK